MGFYESTGFLFYIGIIDLCLYQLGKLAPLFKSEKCIFGGNVCFLASITFIHRMFIVSFGLEKPEGDTASAQCSIWYTSSFNVNVIPNHFY